ncbi:hypothetical protein ACWGCI_28405 [Streptomyces sp. NPDC054949]
MAAQVDWSTPVDGSGVTDVRFPDGLDPQAVPAGALVDVAVDFTPGQDSEELNGTASLLVVVPVLVVGPLTFDGPFNAGRPTTVTFPVQFPETALRSTLTLTARTPDRKTQFSVSVRVEVTA